MFVKCDSVFDYSLKRYNVKNKGMFFKWKEGVMPKHGKNGREAKKAPLPTKTKGPKPQGFFERIVADQKEGTGLLRKKPLKSPPRITNFYFISHKSPDKPQ